MMRKSTYLPYWDDDVLGLQALEIPYQAMSMLVLLPREGSLETVDRALDAELVERIAREMEARDVELRLPRLELKMDYDLTATLQAMGMEAVFDRDASDLSGITDDPDGLALSQVVHQARVKVDELSAQPSEAESSPQANPAKDPGEKVSHTTDRVDPTEALQDWMAAISRNLNEFDEEIPEPLDEESIERLRALGYAD